MAALSLWVNEKPFIKYFTRGALYKCSSFTIYLVISKMDSEPLSSSLGLDSVNVESYDHSFIIIAATSVAGK